MLFSHPLYDVYCIVSAYMPHVYMHVECRGIVRNRCRLVLLFLSIFDLCNVFSTSPCQPSDIHMHYKTCKHTNVAVTYVKYNINISINIIYYVDISTKKTFFSLDLQWCTVVVRPVPREIPMPLGNFLVNFCVVKLTLLGGFLPSSPTLVLTCFIFHLYSSMVHPLVSKRHYVCGAAR